MKLRVSARLTMPLDTTVRDPRRTCRRQSRPDQQSLSSSWRFRVRLRRRLDESGRGGTHERRSRVTRHQRARVPRVRVTCSRSLDRRGQDVAAHMQRMRARADFPMARDENGRAPAAARISSRTSRSHRRTLRRILRSVSRQALDPREEWRRPTNWRCG